MTPAKGRLLSLTLFLILVSAKSPVLAASPASVPLAPALQELVRDAWNTADELHRLEAQGHARTWSNVLLAKSLETPNMELYDVTFYDLDLYVDHAQERLTGTVTVVAQVVGPELSELDLNLQDALSVTGVRTGTTVLGHSHGQAILTVTLDRTYLTGETVTLEVDYEGDPTDGETGDTAFGTWYFTWETLYGQPLIFTLSESYGASYWWPCKNVNTDKPDSMSMHVTVDDPLYVVSNGTLREVTVPENDRSTYHWHESYPIATYLVSMAIHPYVITEDTYYPAEGDPMPMMYYTFQQFSQDVLGAYGILNEIMAVFEQFFGPYPFITEKYGHVHTSATGMENQTCASMHYAYMDPNYANGYAHELAHQWFGDLISCTDFHHIWLNEGLATWAEALWFENYNGIYMYHAYMDQAAYYDSGTIYVENIETEEDIWGDFNIFYRKGAWVVHMLRHVLGDEDFFAGLIHYRQLYAHSDATTEQFQDAMEAVSGRDLSAFFQQWIYEEYYPVYTYSWSSSPFGDESRITLRIEQAQTNTGLFTMPLDVLIETDLGDHTFVVDNSEQVEFYTLTVPGSVLDLNLDPEGWVLCEKEFANESNIPQGLTMNQRLGNVPNPFNPLTEIHFTLPHAMSVELGVYDVRGRLVRILVGGEQPAGDGSVRWDGTDFDGQAVASGTYCAVLRGEDLYLRKTMTLVR